MSSRSGAVFSTAMPSVTGWVQAAMYRPATRTVQIRQLPTGLSPS